MTKTRGVIITLGWVYRESAINSNPVNRLNVAKSRERCDRRNTHLFATSTTTSHHLFSVSLYPFSSAFCILVFRWSQHWKWKTEHDMRKRTVCAVLSMVNSNNTCLLVFPSQSLLIPFIPNAFSQQQTERVERQPKTVLNHGLVSMKTYNFSWMNEGKRTRLETETLFFVGLLSFDVVIWIPGKKCCLKKHIYSCI